LNFRQNVNRCPRSVRLIDEKAQYAESRWRINAVSYYGV
jgi:hypothetical protein